MTAYPAFFKAYWHVLKHWDRSSGPMFDPMDVGWIHQGRIARNVQILRNNALHHQSKKAHAQVWRLRKMDLREHVDGRQTFYFVNNPRNALMLAMIDVDGHRPGQRPDEVKDAILARFPGIYCEPSTSGSGWHLYVTIGGPNPAARNDLAQLLVRSLAALVPNPDMTLDRACGTYPAMKRDNDMGRRYWEYVSDGQLAKFPRLLDGSINSAMIEELRLKIAASQWDDRRSRLPAHLVAACLDDPMGQRVLSLVYTQLFSPAHINELAALAGVQPIAQSQPVAAQSVQLGVQKNQLPSSTPTCGAVGKTQLPTDNLTCGAVSIGMEGLERKIADGCGRERKVAIWLKYKQSLGRLPEEAEFINYYVQAGYIRNRSKDPRARSRQLASIHRYCIKNYGDMPLPAGFDLGNYAWVKLDAQIIKAARQGRHPIRSELVCIILYLVEHPALQDDPVYWFTCGIERVKAFCGTLHDEGVIKPKYHTSANHRISDAIRAAEAHGFVEQIDLPAEGVARKLIPGVSNPCRAEFMRSHGRQVELVKNVIAAMPGVSRPDPNAARRRLENEQALAECRGKRMKKARGVIV